MEPTDAQLKQLQEEFEKTLIFPKSKDLYRKQFFLCPVGLIGSGKTTVMKPLCERLHALRVSGDEIRKLFKERGFGWERVAELGLILGGKYAEEGYSIGIDSDCVREEKRKGIERIAHKVGAKTIYIHINPPEEFILNKLRNFKHTWLFRDKEQAIQNYMTRRPLHQRIDIDFVYTFDTSKDNLKEQVEEASKIISRLTGLDTRK